MNALTNEFKVIDSDAHVIEPYDLWTSRLSKKKWGDLVPEVRFDKEAGEDAWYFGKEKMGAAAGPGMAEWHEFPPNHPKTISDLQPWHWRAADRLKKMDEYGVYAHVLYPNVAGFAGGKLFSLGDLELMSECIRAYNDWVAEWASADPKRLIPMAAIPFWSIDETVKEMERTKKMGFKGTIFTNEPTYFDQPKISDPYWDRFWAASQDMQLPVNFHVASGDRSAYYMYHESVKPHAAFAGLPAAFGMGNVPAIVQLINGGVCHRFPNVKFVSVESGVGWIPFLLDTMDWMWKACGVAKESPEYKLLPSEFFKRQFYGCFWFEQRTLKSAIDQLGPDNILFETDFPHPTSMSPGPASAAQRPGDYIETVLKDYPREVCGKILHDNAAKLYHLD